MMIALVILGFGLLIVGAALPVGMSYTRDTVDRGTGDAAVEYGLNLIEQNVRLCRDPWDDLVPPGSTNLRHKVDLFQPREYQKGPGTPKGRAISTHEPLLKVRPLLPVGIAANAMPGTELWPPSAAIQPTSTDVELLIQAWLGIVAPGVDTDDTAGMLEYDARYWIEPAVASVCAVYPPIEPDTPFKVADFFATPTSCYQPRPVWDTDGAETRKTLDRRFSWAAFYRRVSYARRWDASTSTYVLESDPNLYEFIVVACRLPGPGYRYPRFQAGVAFGGAAAPGGLDVPYGGTTLDIGAPVPWLVFFEESDGWFPETPKLVEGVDYVVSATGDRLLSPNFSDPATITFRASSDVGRLLPRGSLIIPAVNDDIPTYWNPSPPSTNRFAGFIPHAPSTLPVYQVSDRILHADGSYSIVVKNNGFYPWVGSTAVAKPEFWPVWIIPPAFKETQTVGGQPEPVFEDRSPIVAWGRRVVRLRELPSVEP